METSNELKCQECDFYAEYLWKEGRKLIPVCQSCAETWALEKCEENDDVITVDALDEEELAELIQELKEKKA